MSFFSFSYAEYFLTSPNSLSVAFVLVFTFFIPDDAYSIFFWVLVASLRSSWSQEVLKRTSSAKKKAVSFKDIFQAYSEMNSKVWVNVSADAGTICFPKFSEQRNECHFCSSLWVTLCFLFCISFHMFKCYTHSYVILWCHLPQEIHSFYI